MAKSRSTIGLSGQESRSSPARNGSDCNISWAKFHAQSTWGGGSAEGPGTRNTAEIELSCDPGSGTAMHLLLTPNDRTDSRHFVLFTLS